MTDWSDIGAVTRKFGNERERLDEILANRRDAGRNFWKEAADEIERLRGELKRAKYEVGRSSYHCD